MEEDYISQFDSKTDTICTIGNDSNDDCTNEIIYTTTATPAVCNSISTNTTLTSNPYCAYEWAYELPSYSRIITNSNEVEVESLKEQISELTKRISNLTSIILSHVGEAEMEKLVNYPQTKD